MFLLYSNSVSKFLNFIKQCLHLQSMYGNLLIKVNSSYLVYMELHFLICTQKIPKTIDFPMFSLFLVCLFSPMDFVCKTFQKSLFSNTFSRIKMSKIPLIVYECIIMCNVVEHTCVSCKQLYVYLKILQPVANVLTYSLWINQFILIPFIPFICILFLYN